MDMVKATKCLARSAWKEVTGKTMRDYLSKETNAFDFF